MIFLKFHKNNYVGELITFINKNVSRQANQTPQLNGDPEQVLVQW